MAAKKLDPVEAFCRALWRGEKEVIRRLEQSVDPNGCDRFGYTPLLMAAQYGERDLVALLVARGAEVEQGRRFLTPLTFAARRNDAAIVACLRDAGATPSVVTWIYLGGERKVASEIARDPGLVGLCDEAGTPLVLHAAEGLRPRILSLLLDRGAGVASTDANGETALHRVADVRRGAADDIRATATLLLDRGADANARNWDDVTPLHQAVRARNLAAVEVLLERGADPNARDKGRGSTPLRRAVSATGAGDTAGKADQMLPLTTLLLEYGADPDARDKRGIPVYQSARDPEIKALLEVHRRAKGRD